MKFGVSGTNSTVCNRRCRYYRGRNWMKFGVFGTNRTVCNRGADIIESGIG